MIYQGGKGKIGKEIAEYIEMVEDIFDWDIFVQCEKWSPLKTVFDDP